MTAPDSSGRGTSAADDALFTLDAEGVFRPRRPVASGGEHYPEEGFDLLERIQEQHFWYRGRHRFVHHFASRVAERLRRQDLEAIDLGGGCGGWVRYLQRHPRTVFASVALADGSLEALRRARPLVAAGTRRYHIDLLDLGWSERWPVAFLLDVLEHIEDDAGVLGQIFQALKPGGYLIVTTPAFERFRTAVDQASHHVRRYTRADFTRLAGATGFELVTSRYFMFLLSPLLLLSRWRGQDMSTVTIDELRTYYLRTAEVPPAPINAMLGAIFASETPLGAAIPFPWGTSVLAVLRRPS